MSTRTPVPALDPFTPGLSDAAADVVIGDTAPDPEPDTDLPAEDSAPVDEAGDEEGTPEPGPVSEVAPRRRPRSPNGQRRPRKSRAKKGTNAAPTPPRSARPATPRAKPIEQRVTSMLEGTASALLLVGVNTGNVPLFNDGAILTEQSKPLGDALGAIARENPEVARILDKLTTTSAYGALLMAVLPLAVGVLRNHNIVAVPDRAAAMLGVPEMVDADWMQAWAEQQMSKPDPAP